MCAKILGVLMLLFGSTLFIELFGSVLWSALELVGLLAKLLLSGGIAYIGFRLITGARSVA